MGIRYFWVVGFLSLSLSPASGASGARNGPVVVELFTSEGCSSCPPADQLLARLTEEHEDVIALSEHVDYWNSLGWRDPFSSSHFSERQQIYARRFRLESVYTPQMVVDGNVEFVGSNSSKARSAIDQAVRAEKIPVTLAVHADAVHVEATASRKLAVMAAWVTGEATSKVSRGENGGRTLRHVAVVRELKQIGTTGPDGFRGEVPIDRAQPADRIVVFLQEPAQGRIVGVASAAIAQTSR